MSKIIFDKYKIINLILFLATGFIVSVIYFFIYNGYCKGSCSVDLMKGAVNPLYNSAKILLMIFGFSLLVPSHIFKKWLFTLFPIFFIVMLIRISTIDINEYGGILQFTRSSMAQFGTVVFGWISLAFVVIHLLYDWYKNRHTK